MGSIIAINKNPETWPAYPSKKYLIQTGESLMHITYGSFDDYPDGTLPLTCYMRESVYNKLLSHEYHIQTKPGVSTFQVMNNANTLIPPVTDSGIIY